jgi:hypothetical protein
MFRCTSCGKESAKKYMCCGKWRVEVPDPVVSVQTYVASIAGAKVATTPTLGGNGAGNGTARTTTQPTTQPPSRTAPEKKQDSPPPSKFVYKCNNCGKLSTEQWKCSHCKMTMRNAEAIEITADGTPTQPASNQPRVDESAARQQEQDRLRKQQEEAARLKAEQERQAEQKRQAEEAAQRQEEARLKAEAERRQQEEARLKAEAERRQQEEAARKAQEKPERPRADHTDLFNWVKQAVDLAKTLIPHGKVNPQDLREKVEGFKKQYEEFNDDDYGQIKAYIATLQSLASGSKTAPEQTAGQKPTTPTTPPQGPPPRNEQAEKEAAERAEAERKAKEEADRKAREEADRKAREEAAKQLAEQKRQEQAQAAAQLQAQIEQLEKDPTATEQLAALGQLKQKVAQVARGTDGDAMKTALATHAQEYEALKQAAAEAERKRKELEALANSKKAAIEKLLQEQLHPDYHPEFARNADAAAKARPVILGAFDPIEAAVKKKIAELASQAQLVKSAVERLLPELPEARRGVVVQKLEEFLQVPIDLGQLHRFQPAIEKTINDLKVAAAQRKTGIDQLLRQRLHGDHHGQFPRRAEAAATAKPIDLAAFDTIEADMQQEIARVAKLAEGEKKEIDVLLVDLPATQRAEFTKDANLLFPAQLINLAALADLKKRVAKARADKEKFGPVYDGLLKTIQEDLGADAVIAAKAFAEAGEFEKAINALNVKAEESKTAAGERRKQGDAADLERARLEEEERERNAQEELARQQAAAEEAERQRRAEEAARQTEEVPEPATQEQANDFALTAKEQQALEGLKGRHQATHKAVTAALDSLPEMVEKAQKAAEEADKKAEAAEKKVEAAEELSKQKAAAHKLAVAAAIQDNPALKDEKGVLAEWQNQVNAILKKRYDLYKKAMKDLTDEVIPLGYQAQNIHHNLNNVFIANGDAYFPTDEDFKTLSANDIQTRNKKAMEHLKKGWDYFTGLLELKEGETPQAQTKASFAAFMQEEAKQAALEEKLSPTVAEQGIKVAKQEAELAAEAAEEAGKELDFARTMKLRLLHMVQFGPLAKTQDPNVQQAQAKILEQFKDHPEVAVEALGLVHKAKHPAELAKGVAVAGGLAKKGFPHKILQANGQPSESNYSYLKDTSLSMARNALQLSGMLGHPYVDDLAAFNATAPLPDHVRDEKGKKLTHEKRGVAYTRDMAKNLFVNGQVDFGPTNTNLNKTIKTLKFHPDYLGSPMFSVLESLEDVRAKFTGPEQNAYKAALNGVTAPSQHAITGGAQTAKKMVADSLGLPVDDAGQPTGMVTNLHAKQAVMSALLTPFAQGPVGSCFATGPVLKFKEEQTLDYIKDLKQIVAEGTLGRPPHMEKIPVISELPGREKENALSRCHEYTITTLGARVNGTQEKATLDQSLFGPPVDSFASLGTPQQRLAIKQKVAEKFNFVYLPEEETGEVSADGSSTKGTWALMAGNTKIGSPAQFCDELKQVVKSALSNAAAPNTPLGNQVNALCKADNAALMNGILSGYNPPGTADDKRTAPWKLSSGGSTEGPVAVLFGNPPGTLPGTASLIGKPGVDPTAPVTNRAEALLGKLVEGAAPDKKKTAVSVAGIHGMNLLPSDPSMLALKPDANKTTAQKIQEQFVAPGQALAGKHAKETAAHFQARAADAFRADFPQGIKALTPPAGEMTPREIMNDLLAKFDAEIQAKVNKALADGADDITALIQQQLVAAQQKHAAALQKHTEDPTNNPAPDPAPTENALRAKHRAGLVDEHKDKLEKQFSAVVLKEMAPPEVVIANTNWGSPTGRTFHVMAPDPLDGALKMWAKTEPVGNYSLETPDWLETSWKTVG